MKQTFNLTDRVVIGEYIIEYSNFNLFIKKNGSLIKCLEKRKDYNHIDYTKDINKIKEYILKR